MLKLLKIFILLQALSIAISFIAAFVTNNESEIPDIPTIAGASSGEVGE